MCSLHWGGSSASFPFLPPAWPEQPLGVHSAELSTLAWWGFPAWLLLLLSSLVTTAWDVGAEVDLRFGDSLVWISCWVRPPLPPAKASQVSQAGCKAPWSGILKNNRFSLFLTTLFLLEASWEHASSAVLLFLLLLGFLPHHSSVLAGIIP